MTNIIELTITRDHFKSLVQKGLIKAFQKEPLWDEKGYPIDTSKWDEKKRKEMGFMPSHKTLPFLTYSPSGKIQPALI